MTRSDLEYDGIDYGIDFGIDVGTYIEIQN